MALVEAEKALQSEIEKSKQEIEADLIRQFEHSNNNEIYKYISNLTNTRGLPDTMTNGNDTVTGGPEIANYFNKYFYSVFTKDDSQPQQPEFVSSFSTESISFSVSDVFNIMSTLNTTKATGIDNISPVLLKNCANSLSTPVHTLFLLSITRGTLPKEWKTHLITPIFKSGDKADIRNYRPVSLLCILSKVLEKLIYNSLSEFVSNRISTQQFGFTKGRSSLQQLLVYFSNVVDATDGSASVDVMYLDLCRAFDSVSHTKLLHKLHTYGISGKLWNWFKSYLHSRQQCVRVDGAISCFLPVLSGVPQGSILGPLLFLLYINDLPDCLETSIMYMFADDSKCIHIIQNFNDTIDFQDDLNSVYHWSQTWKLKFNLSKTAFIQFGNNSAGSSNYLLNGTTVNKQTSTKDLGIIVTSDMSWSNHYKSIASKAYKSLGLIRRTFKTNSVCAKKMLYISLVRSKLTYCSQLWRPQYIQDIVLLENIQRRATKYILNDYASSYRSRLIHLSLLPLMHIYELNDIMFFIKSLKRPTNSFKITNYVSFSSSSTRSSINCKLVHKRSRLNTNRHFYFNRLPRLWNTLPPINLSHSISTIKSMLLKHMWSHFLNHFNPDIPCSFHCVCPCNRCNCTPHPPLL